MSLTAMHPWQYACLVLVPPVTALILYRLWKKYATKRMGLRHQHFVITGGSSGIGRAMALLIVRRGGNVTIVARNKERLEDVKLELLDAAQSPEQAMHIISADLAGDFESLVREVRDAEDCCGPIDYLVNCAGSAVSQRFEETPLDDFEKMIRVNYLSAVQATRAVLPGMKQRNRGSVTFVSSIAGVLGMYGFTAYCPAKFALLGFAEALRMEVKHHGIDITVCFPPDTDTPGFAEEQKSKPIETKLICGAAGLSSAESVALSMLDDILERNFAATVGFDGRFILTLCAGMMPFNSWLDLMVQVLSMGFLRLVGVFYLGRFYSVVASCASKREGSKKSA
ncbi:3-ketodihydrosphingosine reductase-like [Ornithodoros turicata]|uniref:3-ketodihydrosphingosine reductase-like n=1 Tax=Ornithodoros turicata TaxID=34597 RepID=UPI003138A152